RRIPKRRADLVNLELDRRTRLAFPVLVRPLLELTLRDDAHALGQRSGDVLGELAPTCGPVPLGFAVLPFLRGRILLAVVHCDAQRDDGDAAVRVTQLWI